MDSGCVRYGVLLLLLSGCSLLERGPNIAPDAVTRATQGYNEFVGDIDDLVDGRYPEDGSEGEPFVWPGKGNLTFQFDQLERVAGLRLYVGADAGVYEVTAYQGAYLDEEGQIETSQARAVGSAVDFELVENAWVELKFDEPVEADFFELATESSAIFYEVEILIPGD